MNETHPFFARRWSRHQLIVLDLAAGVGFAFVLFTAAVNSVELPPWARIGLPLGLGLPLAVRRVWPLPVFCLTLVLAVIAAVVDGMGFAYIAPAYALYVVALFDRLSALVPSSAIGVVSLITVFGLVVAGGAPREGAPDWLLHIDQLLIGVAALGGAWTIGRAVRERRLYAARDAQRLAERAVTEERLRIARELHDVVTHSVGLIAVKAGVANHVMATRPEEAHDALRVIETASRGALVEMRHLLGVLRSTDVPDLVPAPGLAGLEGLAAQARQAGVQVELDLRIGSHAVGRGLPGESGVRAESAVCDPDEGVLGEEGIGGEGISLDPGLTSDLGPRGESGSEAVSRGWFATLEDGPREGRYGPGRFGSGASSSTAEGGTEDAAPETHAHGAAVSDGAGNGGAERSSTPLDSGARTRGGFQAGDRGGSVELQEGGGFREDMAETAVEAGIGGPGRGSSGESKRLPDGVELSVYRIVQEALTNVVKHAAPARCWVSVVAGRMEVRIEVTDDGPGRRTLPADGPGHGLIGMRERVMMYGGAFEAGSLPKRGFRVFARLPYREIA